MAEKRPLKIAIIGAGLMGSRIGARIAAGDMPDFELCGITDIDGARAASVAADLGTQAAADLDELFALAPDALYIATPDHLHRAPCEAAAKAGIPFIVEKPLATTNEDARAIADAVRQAGIVAEVNFSNRWNPPFAATRARVEAGELGEFVTLYTRLNNTITSPTRNLAWAANTTPAWFLISHCLDLAYWLNGKRAVSVYASGVRGLLTSRGIDTWDSIRAIVRYEDGTDGNFESVWVMPTGQPGPVEFTFRLVGTAGAATVDTSHQYVTLLTADRSENLMTLNWTPERFRSFAKTLSGAAPVVSMEDGVENTRILVALHRSLETGKVEAVQ